MRQFLANLTITRRAALIFLVVITLPMVVLSMVFYHNYAHQITQQAIADKRTAVQQLTANLQTTLLSLDNLGRDLVYRSNVLALLRKPDLNNYPTLSQKYTEQIVLAVKYSLKYQRLGIEDVCLYADNATLKEQSYFYQSARLAGFACYDEFIASGRLQQLYLLNAEETRDYYRRKGSRTPKLYASVLYMRSIESADGASIGVLMFEFTPAQIFQSVRAAPGYFALLLQSGRVFGAQPDPGELDALRAASGGSDLVSLSGRAYPFAELSGYDMIVGTNEGIDLRNYEIQALKLAALIAFLALLQLLLWAALSKYVFGRIHKSISAMDDIVRGGYHGHVPVRGGDELGQIAMRYNTVLDHVDELVALNVEKETAHKTAQIQALQYQMNPHFIYNTLSVFSGQAEKEGNYALSDAISYFGQLLRYNIKDDGLYATLGRELDNARSLFSVYELKYPGQIQLRIDAAPEALPLPIIKYVLQPLLENSILHGRKGPGDALSVSVRAEAQSPSLTLVVEDNGAGIEPDRLRAVLDGVAPESEGKRDSSFIGLKNIRDRIRLFYGEAAGFTIESEQGSFTRVTIRIPIPAQGVTER